MKILSLFTGAGGLDLGFERAGFNIVWANEYDKTIWDTFKYNFPNTNLDTRSITDVPSNEIPSDIDGIIGGPPCQSWSEFGLKRGIEDKRGQLFFEYIRIIKDKNPKFFLAENVSGILASRHSVALNDILDTLKADYAMPEPELLNSNDHGVPQDRERVFFIGYRKDLGKVFKYPKKNRGRKSWLQGAIWDLRKSAVPFGEKEKFPNHEYFVGDFSPHYMSRNRVRQWKQPSFTIQAGARHAPIHPDANPMVFVEKDKFRFDGEVRRLTVRECARIQTFPDSFLFIYKNIIDGYKMVGNAVPVNLAEKIARTIMRDLA